MKQGRRPALVSANYRHKNAELGQGSMEPLLIDEIVIRGVIMNQGR